MARLQDFQPVTPTSSDNLLVVQATGQGLASVGSTLGAKLDKANPTGTGSLSLNKASGSTLGTNAVAVGENCTASGNRAHAEGYSTKATALTAHSEGYEAEANGRMSHAEGFGTKANRKSQHVFGEYNDYETLSENARGNYVEIVGKGTSDSARSNARTLDWNGNEVLAGGLKINSTETVSAIKKTSVSGTTNANGVLWTNISVSSKWILNAYMDVGSSAVDRFVQIGVADGLYGFRCSNSTITGVASNTGVTVYYFYIDAVS